MSSQTVTLTPGQTQQPQLGWQAQSANINNQSNCWLTYQGQYIVSPYQQSIYPFPSGDAAPLFALTATAPPGQQNQPAPGGTCYVNLTDQAQAANPGVVSAQLNTISNQIPLLTITEAAGGTITQTISVPPSVQALLITVEGKWSGITVSGLTSQADYLAGGVISSPAGGFEIVAVSTAIDQQFAIGAVNNNAISAIFTVTGLPEIGSIQLANQPIKVLSGYQPSVLLDGPGININTTVTIPLSTLAADGVTSITVVNSGAGSGTVEITDDETNFQWLPATVIATQSSQTVDMPTPDNGANNLVITFSAMAGNSSFSVFGNPYPAQGGGGSSSSTNIVSVNSKLAVNVGPPVANTWTNVLTVSPAAGTWMFSAWITASTNNGAGAVNLGIRLQDTTNAITLASTSYRTEAVGQQFVTEAIPMCSSYVVPAGAVIALQFIDDSATAIVEAALNVNGTGNNATQLTGIRLA